MGGPILGMGANGGIGGGDLFCVWASIFGIGVLIPGLRVTMYILLPIWECLIPGNIFWRKLSIPGNGLLAKSLLRIRYSWEYD